MPKALQSIYKYLPYIKDGFHNNQSSQFYGSVFHSRMTFTLQYIKHYGAFHLRKSAYHLRKFLVSFAQMKCSQTLIRDYKLTTYSVRTNLNILSYPNTKSLRIYGTGIILCNVNIFKI